MKLPAEEAKIELGQAIDPDDVQSWPEELRDSGHLAELIELLWGQDEPSQE